MSMRHPCAALAFLVFTSLLAACSGGGGGGGETTTGIASFELLDPTPGAGNRFGEKVVLLANGNIVVSDPRDSSVALDSGAVHLYNPLTQTRVASIYGDAANDRLGSGGIIELANGNYVIVSPDDDEGGVIGAGSVRLVNGTSGVEIGAIVGDAAGDGMGSGGVTVLANGNFVVVSLLDDEGSIVDASSVRLIDGTTGAEIGAIVGNSGSDQLGIHGVTELANGNFVIVSGVDTEGGIVHAGSVRLVDGATGAEIGAIVGDTASDQLGSFGVTALANGNFVIVSPIDDEGGVVNAGSVRLVDGATGTEIEAMVGDAAGDGMGSGGVTALTNGNYVIASPFDDVGGVLNAGSVRLVDGTSGAEIGAIAGDAAGDQLGLNGVTVLANGNYVVASRFDGVGGVPAAGSVRLVDGATGSEIGAIEGDAGNDQMGSGGVTALANGNFVAASPFDDVGGVVNTGSVRLVDGMTGAEIGVIVGGVANDPLAFGGVTELANGNFVIVSPGDNVGGVLGAGRVRLVNGATGAEIAAIVGDTESDQLGINGVTALANGNFVIVSSVDDEGGVVNAGSVRLVNGATGAEIRAIVGDVLDDFLGFGGVTALANGNFVIVSPNDDEGGIVDSGSVRRVDGISGAEIGNAITGIVSFDTNQATVTGSPTGDFYILSLPLADQSGLVDSGRVRLIAE